MDINASFPSKYLKSADFTAPRRLLIDTVAMEVIEEGHDPKPVIYFNGAPKGMVLNRTNANIISMLYGFETTAWQGKEIEVFHDPSIQMQGRIVGGIRVRPVQQVAQPVAQQVSQPIQAHADTNGIPPAGFDPATGTGSDDIPW